MLSLLSPHLLVVTGGEYNFCDPQLLVLCVLLEIQFQSPSDCRNRVHSVILVRFGHRLAQVQYIHPDMDSDWLLRVTSSQMWKGSDRLPFALLATLYESFAQVCEDVHNTLAGLGTALNVGHPMCVSELPPFRWFYYSVGEVSLIGY